MAESDEYSVLILELDRGTEDVVVHLLMEYGALGFETKKEEKHGVLLHAYFPAHRQRDLKHHLPELCARVRQGFPGASIRYEIRRMPFTKWGEEWKQHFRPFHVSPQFVIRPPWSSPVAAQNELIMTLDPGQAFGTGLHESTQVCILELETIVEPGMRILDIGSGSGILSIAGIMLGGKHCCAVDIDMIACRATASNAKLNHMEKVIRPVCADALQWLPRGSWDLIVANIIPPVLTRLLDTLLHGRFSGSRVLFSGIPESEANALIALLETKGMCRITTRSLNEWVLIGFTL